MEQVVILIVIGLISLVNWLLQKAAERRERRKAEAAIRRSHEVTDRTRARQERVHPLSRSETAAPPPRPQPQPPRAPAPGDDPFRELMEALGLPPEERRSHPVTRREAERMPPVVMEREEEEFPSLEVADAPPPPPPPLPPPRPVTRAPVVVEPPRPMTAEAAYRIRPVAEIASGRDAGAGKREALRRVLATAAGVRQAVVLSEILGRPRGLAPAGTWPTRDW